MNRDSMPLETLEPEPAVPARNPQTIRWAVGGATALAIIIAFVWMALTLTPERGAKYFDLAVAAVVVGLLSVAARYLLRAEALRRSRLVAAELIGVTFGGAALAVFMVTARGEPVGLARVPALIGIQLFAAILGGAAIFLLAFFVTLGVKAAASLSRHARPEAEGIFIGVVTGSIAGGLTAEVGELGSWFPFLAAAVCGATTYRAVVLHRRYDRD